MRVIRCLLEDERVVTVNVQDGMNTSALKRNIKSAERSLAAYDSRLR
ncbi:hypothetical protein PC129_g20903 [Phytophthora cactorum]|uniref:Uncharacterized protein n=1 Tax=Phytophthora cactorum TaxID=29920 RepID=A0A329RKV2_9STRA|nr:hypothetical protein Pcac1_g26573 [Phytophthora cactorum]KAG2832521.1 hypothetical protein PC112_g6879 [Phytophthora cactorum]KAG2834560.1 hypothetical protein PC111_g5795 [Phytophthora cactorum]KAG2861658.1 hypothetical protein PC113_g6971 [Phytophthora cactorum]KAG2917976.1 hypothetical protein PC114_g6962 [Phytophthora cactorum]